MQQPNAPQKVLRAVAYARVSSQEQSEEGFSIPAQQRLLRDYATTHGITITEEFVDVETARRAGRDGFGKMLDYLKKHPSCRTLLTEKVDRLYRNIADWVKVDDCGVNVHFVKENAIIGPDSRSNDQLIHGFKVLMARNYSQNLGEESLKGMTEKARAGIFPSFAPVGYCNVEGPNGKRIIVPHPTEAPIITDLFARFATGLYSLKSLALDTRERGILLNGRKLYVSTLHQILHKKIYNGTFDWNEVMYQGTHEPLTTKETWDCVQRLLKARKEHQAKAVRREFPFSGLVQCGHCGCSLVGELKTKKKTRKTYVYWHCTGRRGKCPEPYTRQEVLTDHFASTLGELVIPEDILAWLAQEINNTDQTQGAAREATIKRYEAERARIQHQQALLYDDRLDGTIDKNRYDEKARTLQAQHDEIERKLTEARDTPLTPFSTAVDIARLTSNACNAFRDQNETEQRRLLTMILKQATWKDGRLHATLLEPFEQLRRSNQQTTKGMNGIGGPARDFEIWLPGMDSNHIIDRFWIFCNLLISQSH